MVNGKTVNALGSGRVATVGGDFYDDGKKDANGWTFDPPLDTAANARLIAAAPDLLAACHKLVDSESAVEEDERKHQLILARILAAKAIATAEGRAT
jgi:hypothetical protein